MKETDEMESLPSDVCKQNEQRGMEELAFEEDRNSQSQHVLFGWRNRGYETAEFGEHMFLGWRIRGGGYETAEFGNQEILADERNCLHHLVLLWEL